MSKFACEQCQKTFRTQSGLNWHLEHIHIQSQFKPLLDKATLKAETDRAYRKGYEQGKRDWQIWYFCDVCGERIDIAPQGNSHKELIGYMKQHGWGHSRCHEKA